MAARVTVLLPRLAALVLVWLLAAASFTFAAGGNETSPTAATTGAKKKRPDVLVVPDVRRQAYVFAKGTLQDAGFAWRVDGAVEGYAANTVVVQQPAPGSRVIDNGAPTVVLRLERNADYAENGLPESSSSYRGTAVVLLSDWRRANGASESSDALPAKSPAVSEQEEAPAERKGEQPAADRPTYRKPDFVVPGAPREPADEMTLPDRARMLGRRLAAAAKPRPKVVDFWLYQHSWIVTGARFGWKDGDEALRILIRVDGRLQERFGLGAKSEAAARRALAEVLEKKAR